VSEFLAMGGYAIYVWSSYAIAVVVLGLNAILPVRTERREIAELQRAINARTKHDTPS
jgi:heme exporter protein D